MKIKINSHLIFTILSFIIPFTIYLVTMAPTLSFWDCGEFIACSVTLGVPHPPGTPLFLLLGNVFSNFPIFTDIGARVNLISPIASAFSVMFLYLIIVQLIKRLLNNDNKINKIKIAEISAFIAAITFGVTDSHWFNAVETEVYSLSTFFTSIVVWLILKWDTVAFNKGSIKYIILITYMLGLAIGIHLLNLLAIPCIIFIIYYNKNLSSKLSEIDYIKILIDICKVGAISILIFTIIYSFIIKGIPQISAEFSSIWIPVSIFALTLILLVVYIAKQSVRLSTIFLCLLMILTGYSTYSTIFIRASQHPSINENNPDNVDEFLKYMNREQYGSWSIMDRTSTLKRQENIYSIRYTHNKENPFVELFFHYNLGQNKTYMSPMSFGRPDPVQEFADKLKSTGDKDEWIQGKRLEPKMRTFAPVIVRGQESEGVKFWGFGKTVYQELLGVIADPDYGDITDATNGRDIGIERQTPAEAGNQYGKTTVRVKPNQTAITEDAKLLESIMDNQSDLTELYTEPTYDELKDALQNFLNPSDEDSTETTTTSNGVAASTTPTTNTSTKTEEKSTAKVEDAFDELFNS